MRTYLKAFLFLALTASIACAGANFAQAAETAPAASLHTQMIKVHDMMADRLANELGISIQRGTCSDGYTPCPMHRGMMRGYHHQGMMMPMY